MYLYRMPYIVYTAYLRSYVHLQPHLLMSAYIRANQWAEQIVTHCCIVCLSVYISVCLSVCLYVSLSVCLSLCLSFPCLFVCLSLFICKSHCAVAVAAAFVIFLPATHKLEGCYNLYWMYTAQESNSVNNKYIYSCSTMSANEFLWL